MRHLTVMDYGHFLGLQGQRLTVSHGGEVLLETPLSRLKSISIAKKGVSLSSNLILACAGRGVRIFILDWRGLAIAAVSGTHQHAICQLRRKQFEFLNSSNARMVAARIIFGKLRNQRATLLYLNKYQSKVNHELSEYLNESSARIEELAGRLNHTVWAVRDKWHQEIMGIEGAAAAAYWQSLKIGDLTSESFSHRKGRGAQDITNQLLNYGYTLLSSYIWSALETAGFELYAGVLHRERAGTPALVLDFMEEYRAWTVDRNVIKLRPRMGNESSITPKLKKQLSLGIHDTFSRKYPYRGKKLKLETILQRQVYRFASCVVDAKPYKPYRFKW